VHCEQCGHVLSASAKFCSECGTKVQRDLPYASTAADRIPDDQPIMVLRPRFIPWVTLVSVLPVQLFMTLWATLFCGGFSMAGIKFIQRYVPFRIPDGFTFIFWGCVAFFGLPLATFFNKWRSYAKTEYRFYADRMEYFEGFFVIQQKTIYYRDVREVLLKKGMVQRRYNLGTVILATLASPTDTTQPGIRVADIEGPDNLYEEIKSLVRTARGRTV
jgi:membrane protein YdbS with pleckstrin-like domain